jgi:DNA-binding transcriptional LysR family regulator
MPDLALPDLRRLRLFLEVASLGSFSAAADVLGLSQSAVSQQIRTLERDLGVPLLDRGRRPVELTPAGHTLRRHATGLLAQAARAAAALKEHQLTGSTVTVSAFHSATTTLVADALARIARERPELDVRVLDLHTDAIVAVVRGGEAEYGLVFHELDGDRSMLTGLEHELLLRDPLVVVLPSGVSAVHRPRLRLRDLGPQRWIVPSRTGSDGICRRLVDGAFADAGLVPQIVAESDNYVTTQQMVAKGIGAAMIPALAVAPGLDELSVHEINDVHAARGISIAWLDSESLSIDAHVLRRALRMAATARVGRSTATPGTSFPAAS